MKETIARTLDTVERERERERERVYNLIDVIISIKMLYL